MNSICTSFTLEPFYLFSEEDSANDGDDNLPELDYYIYDSLEYMEGLNHSINRTEENVSNLEAKIWKYTFMYLKHMYFSTKSYCNNSLKVLTITD